MIETLEGRATFPVSKGMLESVLSRPDPVPYPNTTWWAIIVNPAELFGDLKEYNRERKDVQRKGWVLASADVFGWELMSCEPWLSWTSDEGLHWVLTVKYQKSSHDPVEQTEPNRVNSPEPV
jgi:hypothetical protein